MTPQFLFALAATLGAIDMICISVAGAYYGSLSQNAATVGGLAGFALTCYSVPLFFTVEPATLLVGGSLLIITFAGLYLAGYVVVTAPQWFAAAYHFVVALWVPAWHRLNSTIEFLLPHPGVHRRHA